MAEDITEGLGYQDIMHNKSNYSGSDDYDLYTAPEPSSVDHAADVITKIVIPIICAFGIAGICVTVLVLSRKNMCTSTNCYLMALSITDLLFLILFLTILYNRYTPHTQNYYFFHMYSTYATIFMHVLLMASIWLTVMLACERYIAICRPFLANKLCTVVKARVIVALIYVCALICRLPNFWENRIESGFDPTTNTTIYYMQNSQFSYEQHYTTVYPWIVDGILSSVIPFILLLVLNVRLIWEVKKSTRYLQRNMMMSSTATGGSGAGNVAAREELQITVMLISVVIVFFACQAPYVIYISLSSLVTLSQGFLLFKNVTLLLLALKSAINFLLYCWFSEKFRATLKHLLCSRRCLNLLGQGEKSQNCNYYNMRRISTTNTRDTTI